MNPSDQARQVGVVSTWVGQNRYFGEYTDPPGDLILLDTDELMAGFYDVDFILSYSAAMPNGTCALQWRNAANTGNLLHIDLKSTAAGIFTWKLQAVKVAMSERFRFFNVFAWTGILHYGIVIVRRA